MGRSSFETFDDGDILVAERPKLQPPPRYNVVFHNDDTTPFVFVLEVLMAVFGKSREEAVQLTNLVHVTGRAVVATYPKSIAETKTEIATSLARQHAFPLRVTFEKA
jgi:ATP-dependent Clp protease adaptor protein ClpS